MAPDDRDLAARLCAGERSALARAITLVESTRADHRERALALMEEILPRTGGALRIGISGTPGVGKSTFIESFGQAILGKGHRLAVLAVDPSSGRSGGSILGDKTRMEKLSVAADAFIRPSPSGRTLGGVARRTREAMLLCEAAGFDTVLVETVGVGQSETAVADMVDMFLLLLQPGSGDELQGIKRGIVELADILVVNKADGDMAAAAERTLADYRSAIRLLRPANPAWEVTATKCSALHGDGIGEIWEIAKRFRETAEKSGFWQKKRAGQARRWMWDEIEDELVARFCTHEGVARDLAAFEEDVAAGRRTPAGAARALLETFLARESQAPKRHK